MSTIYEVAQLAGVSPKTAARILSGNTGYPANRSKVLEAAKRLGYVRNQHAANLRSGQSGLIGLIVSNIANPQYTHFCRYAHDAARQHGYRIILANTYGKVQEEASALEIFQANRVEALILSCAEGEIDKSCDQVIRSLLKRNIPVLIGGRPLRGLPADSFNIEDSKAIAKAVNYLSKSGRKRIAFFSGSKHLLGTQVRYQGFQDAIAKYHLEFNPDHVSFGDFTVESGYQQAQTLLRQNPNQLPDAVVCANDLLAIGVIQAAYDNGVNVPDQLAVMGFDDIPFAEYIRPRLTTLHQPLERMAREGIDLLVSRIHSKDVSNPRVLSYELDLMVRDSA